MKEIVCTNKKCKHNKSNHCMVDGKYLYLDFDGCLDFEQKEYWKEGIQETVSKKAYTKSDLKDIEENKAKYGTTQRED